MTPPCRSHADIRVCRPPAAPAVRVASHRTAMETTRRTARTFTDDHRKRLERAVTLYLQHCYRHATAARVSEFATFLGRNRDYISRTAAAILGLSLREFLRAKQLTYAARLLRTTPLPMKEIALRAGFGTTATFYRCFVALHEMPPARFREVMK